MADLHAVFVDVLVAWVSQRGGAATVITAAVPRTSAASRPAASAGPRPNRIEATNPLVAVIGAERGSRVKPVLLMGRVPIHSAAAERGTDKSAGPTVDALVNDRALRVGRWRREDYHAGPGGRRDEC